MPMYDRRCSHCGSTQLDCYEPIGMGNPACECGGDMHRVWLSRANGVIPDSIPGGIEIRHGLCWPDGSPRTFYSYSDIRAAERTSTWENRVEHVPSHPGSDKSKWTSRWV